LFDDKSKVIIVILFTAGLCPGPDQRPEFPIWDIMDPKDLYLFAIPFHMDGDTTVGVGGLVVL